MEKNRAMPKEWDVLEISACSSPRDNTLKNI